MNFLDRLRSFFGIRARQPQQAQPATIRANGGGRASIDFTGAFNTSAWLIVPPASYEANWQLLTIDSKALERIPPLKLMEILADLSPEVSKALWDFLRLCNPGWELTAYKINGETEDKAAQAALDAFVEVLEDRYGSFDIVVGRLFTGVFLRGALCAELVLDERGRMPLDIATPDPSSIRFQRRTDPVLGNTWRPGQWQTDFIPLDIPTFRYMPIDPLPGSPYGRPLAAPALFSCLFLLGMLHDLKRVIQQQGYPRLDLSIDIEQLAQQAPQIASNAQAFQEFTNDLVQQVEEVYRQLKPDDAYIHTSNVSVNKPVGAADAGNLGGIDAVVAMLERMAIRALKTMPLLLGVTDAVGDVQSSRQFELYSAGIRSIQHYAEIMLNRLFTMSLQAQGIQADVEFCFSEFRASEELRDAQVDQLKISNARSKYQAGWITNDEAAEDVVGHSAASEPVAPPVPNSVPGIGNTDGQPSVQNDRENTLWVSEVRAARLDVQRALDAISKNGYH